MDINKFIADKYQTISTQVINIMPTVLMSIFIFIIFLVLAYYYKNNISNYGYHINIEQESQTQTQTQTQTKTQTQSLIYYELGWIVYYLFIIGGFIFAIINLGVQTTTILTILGTFGLAIGLAIQGSLINIISGIYISLLQMYDIGDLIKINQLGYSNYIMGTVKDFNLFNTTIIDANSHLKLTIPNIMIQNNVLTNITKSTS